MPTITCAGLFFCDFWLASGTAYPPNKYPVESISQWLGSPSTEKSKYFKYILLI